MCEVALKVGMEMDVLELGVGGVGVVVVRARVNIGMWWRWVWEIVLELRVEVGGTPDHHLLPPPLATPSTVSPHSKLHIVIQCHGPPLPVSM